MAANRVERGAEQRARARRLEQGYRAVDDRFVEKVSLAELQDRRLAQAAEHLVDRGVHEVGAGLDRRLGEQVGEVQVRPPGLVDDERHPTGVSDLGEPVTSATAPK